MKFYLKSFLLMCRNLVQNENTNKNKKRFKKVETFSTRFRKLPKQERVFFQMSINFGEDGVK